MKKLLLSFLILLTLAQYSCVPVYRPTSYNIPMFDSADELHMAAHIGTNGVDVQTAYSIDDEFAVMINGSFANRNDNNADTNTFSSIRRHTFVEMGVGYYDKIGKNGMFELYAGAGAGQSEAVDVLNGDSISAQGDFVKLFIQPSISFKSKNAQFGFVNRFSYITFSRYEDDFDLNSGNFVLRTTFIEPAIFFSFGNENIRFIWQSGFSVPLSPIEFTYNPFITTFGLRFIIPQVGIKPKY